MKIVTFTNVALSGN